MSALVLRLIACTAMLIDHIGYLYDLMPLRVVGRIAFPLFVYLLVNGFRHTSSRWRYALRLGIFALLSQIPFSLFCYDRLWQPNGNVFFTLLLALLCIWSADALRQRRGLRWLALLPSMAVALAYHYGVIASDYGARGILLALVFYLFDGKPLWMTLGMLCAVQYAFLLSGAKQLALWLLGQPAHLPGLSKWAQVQTWSALALPLIWSYNGRKGQPGRLPARLVQYGFYAFYPVHQFLLWAIGRWLV